MPCFKVHSLSCCRFTLTFWLLPLIKHLHVLNSALRTVNPDVGDHNSGTLQMLLALWSACHFTFPARPTIQMFIDIGHIHFETLSRFQSVDVQFRWCKNVIKSLETNSWNIHHHKLAKLAYYSTTADVIHVKRDIRSVCLVSAWCLCCLLFNVAFHALLTAFLRWMKLFIPTPGRKLFWQKDYICCTNSESVFK